MCVLLLLKIYFVTLLYGIGRHAATVTGQGAPKKPARAAPGARAPRIAGPALRIPVTSATFTAQALWACQ